MAITAAWWGMAPMPFTELSGVQKQLLLRLARTAIADVLDLPDVDHDKPALNMQWLQQPAATFVTLTLNGNLRGCIGTLEAHRTLADDIAHNAVSAALHDPRFPPLTARELPQVEIHISILSPPQALPVTDKADLLRKLRPGVDGLVLKEGAYRATFLPQVWAQLPEPEAFLSHLSQKAGLAADHWSDTLSFQIYQVVEFSEHGQQ